MAVLFLMVGVATAFFKGGYDDPLRVLGEGASDFREVD